MCDEEKRYSEEKIYEIYPTIRWSENQSGYLNMDNVTERERSELIDKLD